tara:strand:+ start:143 stop:769 length:627 start_codon:yes stop_codon:yes gene_type:complete
MYYSVASVFPTPLIQVEVEEDTSELLGHNQYTVSDEQRFDYEKPSASRRVLEEYPKTKEILLNKFIFIAEKVLGYKKRDYAITTSWFSLTNKGEGSQKHNHKNSFWSCVYYYQKEYCEETGKILFESPNYTEFDFYFSDCDIDQFNNLNGMTATITPKPNLLLIFPSYLKHQITKHNNNTSRSSLAFNIVPLGRWGEGDSLYDQAWFT